jgi:hypothetical protein
MDLSEAFFYGGQHWGPVLVVFLKIRDDTKL